MIISGAVNVFPATVEAVLYEHPAVAEAAVVGAPHPEWGEAVVAFLKLAEGHESATAEVLTQFCLTRLSKAEVPKHFIFVSELPKTTNAKISKHPLKRMLNDNPSLLPWGGAG
jgi:acyl-CoA synthetase (AMP-forming)/AMP-acid ligase II